MQNALRPFEPFGLRRTFGCRESLGQSADQCARTCFKSFHPSGPVPMFARRLPAVAMFLVLQLVAGGLAFGQDSKDSEQDGPPAAAGAAAAETETGMEGDPANPETPAQSESPAKADSPASPESEQAPLPVTGLVASLTIFVLAIFVGFEIITKVPPTLHTPLMSGSNAISGITIVGALLVTGGGKGWLPPVLGVVALALATINVVGGFVVTHRMLAMFKRKK